MTIKGLPDALFAKLPESVTERIVEMWRHAIGDGTTLIAVSAFGDLLLRGPQGEPLFLDLIEGYVKAIAPSWEDLEVALRAQSLRDELFLEGFVDVLRGKGTVLGPGQCYAFAVPPTLGGPITLENVVVMDAVVYEHIIVSVHRDLASRPAGSQVDGISVGGRVPTEK